MDIGKWVFLIGIVIAIVAGLITSEASGYWIALLVVLGLIVGFLNITGKEITPFLIASIALILTTSALSALPLIGIYLTPIMDNVKIFVAPAAIVIALKAIFALAAKK